MSHASGLFAIRTSDAEEAIWRGSKVFYSHRFRHVAAGDFDMHLDGAFAGPLTTATLSYQTELEMDVDRLGAYHVNVPIAGRLKSRTERGTVLASPDLAVVYRPSDCPVLRFDGGTVLAVRFDAAFLEDEAAVVTGGDQRGVVPFDDALPLSAGPGAAWWAMMRVLRDPAVLATLAAQPLVAAPFVDALARCLIAAADQSSAPPSSAGRSTAIRACDLVVERPDALWTVTELARMTGVAVRTLQLAFARHVGCTPMQYVSRVRLECAHRDLVDAEPGQTTVAIVANRWGFSHLGRFAAAHVDRFGVTPSVVLRQGRSGVRFPAGEIRPVDRQ
jgi:AraC-like DNA-binding protein